MGLQNLESKDMRLVLSRDAKPRLKWTPLLHQRFVDSVTQLGGADKATPKSLKSVMNIHGLTLYHLKSHLQKYRQVKSQLAQSDHKNRQENNLDSAIEHDRGKKDENSSDAAQIQMKDFQIARALKMQMEVQRKLHEQIEVQRHLQLKIEAQGKYLQSVLMKAQETVARYDSSSSPSAVTKIDGSISIDTDRNSPTSSLSTNSSILSLMDMNPGNRNGSKAEAKINKRSRTNICNDNWIEEPYGKICDTPRTDEQFTSGPEVIDFIGRCL